jgi:hypothetical protein
MKDWYFFVEVVIFDSNMVISKIPCTP